MKHDFTKEQGFTDEEVQQFKDEGLIEVSPGVWGYVGEHVEENVKSYENINNSGYWIVTSGA